MIRWNRIDGAWRGAIDGSDDYFLVFNDADLWAWSFHQGDPEPIKGATFKTFQLAMTNAGEYLAGLGRR